MLNPGVHWVRSPLWQSDPLGMWALVRLERVSEDLSHGSDQLLFLSTLFGITVLALRILPATTQTDGVANLLNEWKQGNKDIHIGNSYRMFYRNSGKRKNGLDWIIFCVWILLNIRNSDLNQMTFLFTSVLAGYRASQCCF